MSHCLDTRLFKFEATTLLNNCPFNFLLSPSAVFAQPPKELEQLKKDVEDFAKQFPTIGFEKSSMRYKD